MTYDKTPVLARIAKLLAPYRPQMLLVALAVVVSATFTSIVPFLTKAVFDDALFPPLGGKPDLGLLGWLALGMVLIPIATAIISICQNLLTSRIGNSAMADLRGDLFAHLQKMELAFFTATKTGSIQSRLANDVAGVRTVLTDTATSIVQNSVTVIAAFISMVILSWQLTILTLILMPLFVYIQRRVGQRRQRLARHTQESLSEMTAITEEALSVSGILLAKVFNRSESEVERYRLENKKQTRLHVDQAMAGRTFFAFMQTFFAITPALIYLLAGQMMGSGTALTAGTLIAFTTLQARLQMPLMQLMRVSLDVQTSLALFRRIFEYLDLVPAIADSPNATSLASRNVRGEVEFRDVSFRYPEPRPLRGDARDRFGNTGVRIERDIVSGGGSDSGGGAGWTLQDVSLTVKPGQFAAIVGPSGAGKTTMSYLVPRYYDVSKGSVRIDGHDIRELTMGSVAEAVGVVTQEPYLFHGTIRDNIAYAKPDATAGEIERAARDANIHDAIMTFADGYETITGERGYRLSGGEKQRLAIARVLLMDPPILILDEATSSLDTGTERLVQEALERATHNRTTIAIAHRLSTIGHADVIFGLEDGRLVEQGTHSELLAAGGLYSRLYLEQFGAGQIDAQFAGRENLADIPL